MTSLNDKLLYKLIDDLISFWEPSLAALSPEEVSVPVISLALEPNASEVNFEFVKHLHFLLVANNCRIREQCNNGIS